MVSTTGLAQRFGLRIAPTSTAGMVVLSGNRGTIVFNPRLRGVLVCGEVLFRGHRVVVRNGSVSVPKGFEAACEKRLRPRNNRPPPPPPRPRDRSRFHVVIDPGHGGRDPGAIGVRGGYEKTVNLLTAGIVTAQLRARGVRVTMTRTTDVFVPLNERAAIGNRAGADLFVSIHADANGRASLTGFTLFICHTKPSYSDSHRAAKIFQECRLDLASCRSTLMRSRAPSRRLASLVRVSMGKATSSPDRGTKLGALRVLERSVCPAILVELGFLSNPSENLRLLRADYQQKLGTAVASGVIRFLDEQ